MPADEVLLKRVEEALIALPCVEQKTMFGGITFTVRGKMCVTVGADRIMCRIDPAVHDDVVARKGATIVFMKGREYRGYVYVDAGAIKSKRDLDYWVALALDFNSAAESSTQKKRRADAPKRPRGKSGCARQSTRRCPRRPAIWPATGAPISSVA